MLFSPQQLLYTETQCLQCVYQNIVTVNENWGIMWNKKGFSGVVLMDISKAFDAPDYDLLRAILQAYGFDQKCINLIYSLLPPSLLT